jgi:hypothetical protein
LIEIARIGVVFNLIKEKHKEVNKVVNGPNTQSSLIYLFNLTFTRNCPTIQKMDYLQLIIYLSMNV